jgi:hypothetical protein
MNISCRIANADTQCGRITNPPERKNTCAAKLSYALNYAGFEIPKGTMNTYLGKDGKQYFIHAKKMSIYLDKTFTRLNKKPISYKSVYNAIVYQSGFQGGVSGHLDVVYKGKAAQHIYDAQTFIYR